MRLWCMECGEGLQTPTADFCSPECHLMHARRLDNAAAASRRIAAADHRARMKGRERRALGYVPE